MPSEVRPRLKPWSVVTLWSPLLPSSLLLLLTILSYLHAVDSSARVCTLYEPPAPGIHCLHGNEVLEELTDSKWVWMIELYSSWCGHCQKFAPHIKELAMDMEAWSEFFRLGVMDCTVEINKDMCSQFGIEAYPTIRVGHRLNEVMT